MRTKSFGNSIGVERKCIPGVKLALLNLAFPFLESAKNRRCGFEPVEGIVAAQEQRGEVAAVDVSQAAGCGVILREEQCGEGSSGCILAEELIHGAQEALRLVQRDGGLAAQISLQIGHQ